MDDPRMKYVPAARGGALPVDGRRPDPRARGRDDRGDRAPHRGAARVHRGHAEAARAHRLAGQRRDRERAAVRPAAPARRRAHAALGARAGGRRRRPTRPTRRRSSSRGTRRLLGAEICQLYRARLGDGAALARSLATRPTESPRRRRCRRPACCSPRSTAAASGRRRAPCGRSSTSADLLVTPLTAGGERVGLLCAGARRRARRSPTRTPRSRARSRTSPRSRSSASELIEGLTNANIVKDLFEALAAGATTFAAAKAAEVRCDLSEPYLMVCAEPAAGASRARVSGARRPRCWVASCRALAPHSRDRGRSGPGAGGARAAARGARSGSRS